MKLVITVVGKDQVGIIAKVSTTLANNNVNILDISQTILNDKFTMMMSCEMDEKTLTISKLQEQFQDIEKSLNLKIQIFSEDIFNYMHRI